MKDPMKKAAQAKTITIDIRNFMMLVAATMFMLAFALHAVAAQSETGLEKSGTKEIILNIKNHIFDPALVEVPAGEKITLHIINHDNSVEEFESHSLKREKIIPANGSIKISIGPLKEGNYPFVGEFHEATAKGTIVAIRGEGPQGQSDEAEKNKK